MLIKWLRRLVKSCLRVPLFFCTERERSMIFFELLSYLRRKSAKPLTLLANEVNYINLGSGSGRNPGFVSIDFFNVPNIDYAADLRYPLLIGSATANGIFTEHVFEHLTYVEVDRLLAESYRVLKPTGVIRIIVPDVSIFIRNYVEGNKAWFETWETLNFTDTGDPRRVNRKLISPMGAISFVTQEYGHVSAWDFETMSAILVKNGFSDISRSNYRESVDPILAIDLDAPDRRYVSLYIEARKPG